MDDRAWWIWLQHGLAAGSSKPKRIFASYASIEDFYRAGEEGWRLESYFTEREIQRMASFTPEQAQAQLAYAEKLGQRILTPEMNTYPQCLRELRNYPCVLYMQGTLPPVDFMLSIAMVGTRRATKSGCSIAHAMSYELAKAGAVVVSGGALGIDTQAHRGAVEAGGRSICVLGCGIDADYLLSNASLRKAVALDGALISEYPPGTQAMASNFPIRNRIISGLCDATVVVEAAGKSGSLITANDAIDQGRDVFAVPGNVQSTMSRGTNQLIQEGCAPATCALDILHAYETKYRILIPDDPGSNVIFPEAASKPAKQLAKKPEGLSQAAAQLYDSLTGEPQPVDVLCGRTGLQAARVLAAATELELRGIAQASAGQRYALR
ncbi:MAG: DNA-processing protein DprA [Oscillospiraceae bacterium]|jgi:DNA processing protein|nr:DNA-processing protein DprA [Oscillospiraceae bacterium]